jgi:hypothetical protein
LAAGALVIAIASSAPDVAGTFLGSYPDVNNRRDTDAGLTTLAARSLDVSGAERSGAGRSGWLDAPIRKMQAALPAPDNTATATPWLGALRLAPRPGGSRFAVAQPGSLVATRTLEVAVQSGGEADYVEGGDADARRLGDVPTLHVTRRACASGRGLAYNCAAVSEREKQTPLHPETEAPALGGSSGPSRSETCRSARKALSFYVSRYREWRVKMGAGVRVTHSGDSAIRRQLSCSRIRYLAVRWRERARVARGQSEEWFSRTLRKWACIHEHEGRWTANTGNGYFGGLQMTRWFQRRYGPEFYARYGTADRWPVWVQLVAAERAWRECRCFRQWGTAGRCGLK